MTSWAKTTLAVEDSGNANPDGNFRFAGDGYIFNLNTKGLAPGKYNLSFYVGADRNFLYLVSFEVR